MTYIPEALRRLVAERAGGCCEYCRLHEDDTFFTHFVLAAELRVTCKSVGAVLQYERLLVLLVL